jgi:hypothetical protein
MISPWLKKTFSLENPKFVLISTGLLLPIVLPTRWSQIMKEMSQQENKRSHRHNILLYRGFRAEGVIHRVGRVLSFSPVVGIGTPPGENAPPPPPLVPEGGTRSLARQGVGESNSDDEGTYYTVVLCKYLYFVE